MFARRTSSLSPHALEARAEVFESFRCVVSARPCNLRVRSDGVEIVPRGEDGAGAATLFFHANALSSVHRSEGRTVLLEVLSYAHSEARSFWSCCCCCCASSDESEGMAREPVFVQCVIETTSADALFVRLSALVDGIPGMRRVVHLIVNPISGRGQSLALLHSEVLPELNARREFLVHVHVTSGPDEARVIATQLDVSTCDALAVMGGDGTMHEVVQGLCGRSDWRAACRLPLLPIPTGSGNGLAVSLGLSTVRLALFALRRSCVVPLDICSVWTGERERRFSFLSFTSGLIADIDIESERLRWLGAARFTAYAVQRCLFPRRMRGTLLFRTSGLAPADRSFCAGAACTTCAALPHDTPGASSVGNSGECSDCDGAIRCSSGRSACGSGSEDESDCTGSSVDSATNARSPSPSLSLSLTLSSWVTEGAETASCAAAAADSSPPPPGPPSSLPDLRAAFAATRAGEPVPASALPADWCCVAGDMVSFVATNVPFISRDACVSPFAHAGDGLVDLTLVQSASRTELVRMLLAMEKGAHTQSPRVQYVKTSAFAFLPGRRIGTGAEPLLVLDGERLPFGPVRGEVHPGLMRAIRLPDIAARPRPCAPPAFAPSTCSSH